MMTTQLRAMVIFFADLTLQVVPIMRWSRQIVDAVSSRSLLQMTSSWVTRCPGKIAWSRESWSQTRSGKGYQVTHVTVMREGIRKKSQSSFYPSQALMVYVYVVCLTFIFLIKKFLMLFSDRSCRAAAMSQC